jgi:hypothetical protein
LRSEDFCPILIIGENESFCQVTDPWLITFAVEDFGEDGRNRGEAERIFCKIN